MMPTCTETDVEAAWIAVGVFVVLFILGLVYSIWFNNKEDGDD